MTEITPPDGFSFDLAAVTAGAFFAIIMASLLRIGHVAVMVAMSIAGGLVWTLIQGDGLGMTDLAKTAISFLESSASTGFLSGAVIGKSLISLLDGLTKAARPKHRRPPRRRPRHPGNRKQQAVDKTVDEAPPHPARRARHSPPPKRRAHRGS